MPSEKQIRETVIEKLGHTGWICWWPRKVRYVKQQDIFGVYDLIALKGDKVRLIQFTTKQNMKAREKKIRAFTHLHEVRVISEVWGWDMKKGEFEVRYL